MPGFPSIDLSRSKKIFLLAGVGLLLLVLIVIFIVKTLLGNIGPVTLTVWGLWEPESVYQSVIADYRRLHPNITIKYIKQSQIQYRDRLTGALARDDSPDIVTIHNTWLPMLKNYLLTIPEDVYPMAKFKNDFYPVHVPDLTLAGKPVALPLEIDTLALYVDQDLFTAGGLTFPTTWEEFRSSANKLTVRDSTGKIKTAGAALGTASNVDHWQDIVSLMMLQANVDLNNTPNSQAAQDALNYYTTFVTVDKVWDETLDQSTLAFAQGKLAMYFGPSWRYHDLDNFKKTSNPNLNFKVLPVPQLSGGVNTNFATYWANAVSRKSRHPKEAFDFLKYLASRDTLTKLYTAESKLRPFGEPYPRTEMGSTLISDPNVGPFVAAAPTAQSWYLASATWDGDTGINSKISKYYTDAINSSLRGADAKAALDTVAQGVNQILSQYGVVSPSPSPTR